MCDCIAKTEQALKEKYPHHDLNRTMVWRNGDISRVIIHATRSQFAPKGTSPKPISILANFCPFCGEAYDKEEEQSNG